MIRYLIRTIAIVYIAGLILGPLYLIFHNALAEGIDPLWAAISSEQAVHALKLTLVALVISVVINTIFGIACALVLVRRKPRGGRIINAIIDLPFAISPVVVGLALYLTFGEQGWFGTWLVAHGHPVIYAFPAIVLATVFVTMPFVVREVIPVLEEIGDDQEQAAATLGAGGWTTFWRITLPAIRWGVAYGVVLTTARALGEYGAVAVVSGKTIGQTETLTLFIKGNNDSFEPGADIAVYGASLVLASIAVLVLGTMTLLGRGAGHSRPTKEADD